MLLRGAGQPGRLTRCVPVAQLVLAPYPENFTTAQPLQAFLSMPSREGAGFVIEDNYFAGNRGRGTHAGSNGGVIARNKIVDVCFSGISMTPDSSYSDANFASNIVVRAPGVAGQFWVRQALRDAHPTWTVLRRHPHERRLEPWQRRVFLRHRGTRLGGRLRSRLTAHAPQSYM